MKKGLIVWISLTLFFVVLGAVVFRCAIGSDRMFFASDGNIGNLARLHNMLPEQFSGAYTAGPLFGGVSQASFTLPFLEAWLLSPELRSDTSYAFRLIFSSLFLIAYLRLFKFGWSACLFGALSAFWVGSITLSAAGHLGKLGVMMYFSIALYSVEQAVRSKKGGKRIAWASGAGLATGLMLLEQQDVGLLAGLFLGPYTLFRLAQLHLKGLMVWLQVLMPVALLGAGLSLQTALSSYSANVTDVAAVSSNGDERWDFITQWSMVPAEWADLIAPGFMGWSSNSTEGPYWGKIGRSSRWEQNGKGFKNFRLDSLYLGVIPIFLFAVGIYLAARGRDGSTAPFLYWGIAGVVALLLAFGKYSILYKGFYHLPLVGNIRAPIKFLHNMQVAVGIVAAFGLHRILSVSSEMRRSLCKVLGIAALALIPLIGGAGAYARSLDFKEWGRFATVILANISSATSHAIVMSLVLATFFFLLMRESRRVWLVGLQSLLVGAVVLDSIYLTSHYFKSVDVAHYRRGNVVLNYLKQNQGDERIAFVSSGGPYNAWIGVDGPYHGLNLFNFWQMPRMPDEYKNMFAAAGRNQLRLWQLASCRFIAGPAGLVNEPTVKQLFRPAMFFRFTMQNGGLGAITIDRPANQNDQVLLESVGYIPRFALFHDWRKVPRAEQCAMLFSQDFNPLTTVLMEDGPDEPDSSGAPIRFTAVEAETDLREAVVRTNAKRPGILMFTQRYDRRWSVKLDGAAGELLRVNYLSMGLLIPAGTHEVVFSID